MSEQINVPVDVLPETANKIKELLAKDAEARKPKVLVSNLPKGTLFKYVGDKINYPHLVYIKLNDNQYVCLVGYNPGHISKCVSKELEEMFPVYTVEPKDIFKNVQK